MSLDAVPAIGSLADPASTAAAAAAQPATPGVFDALVDSLGSLNSQMLNAEQATTELALGKSDNVHSVMMGAEQTRLAFELMISVRSKVLDAYQELMRMQV